MLKNWFGNNSLLNKYQSLINQIKTLESDLKILSDSELRTKSFKLKKKYEKTQNLESGFYESRLIQNNSNKARITAKLCQNAFQTIPDISFFDQNNFCRNFERPFTPRRWLRSASNFGKTRFR